MKLEEKDSASPSWHSHSLLGLTFRILLPWSAKKKCDQSRQKSRPWTVSPHLPLLASFQHLLKCSGWFLCSHPSFTKLLQSTFYLLASCLKGICGYWPKQFLWLYGYKLMGSVQIQQILGQPDAAMCFHFPDCLSKLCVCHQQKVVWVQHLKWKAHFPPSSVFVSLFNDVLSLKKKGFIWSNSKAMLQVRSE